MDNNAKSFFTLVGIVLFILVTGIGGCMFGSPHYNVWSQEMRGKAAFAEAQQNRNIAVLEAQAKKDSAKHLGEARLIEAQQAAKAEIARAEGTAEANRIVADGLGGPEGYLRYLYIDKLSTNNKEIIYVPTEAGLPILEAGRSAR